MSFKRVLTEFQQVLKFLIYDLIKKKKKYKNPLKYLTILYFFFCDLSTYVVPSHKSPSVCALSAVSQPICLYIYLLTSYPTFQKRNFARSPNSGSESKDLSQHLSSCILYLIIWHSPSFFHLYLLSIRPDLFLYNLL